MYAAIAAELALLNAYVVPLIGEAHVRTNAPPPKMIFIPDHDDFTGVEGPGGNPRPIGGVMAATLVVLQGRTTDHCEGMRDQLYVAVHKACKKASAGTGRAGRYAWTKGTWTRGVALKMTNGVEYRVSFAVAFPIVDRTWEAPQPGDPPQEPTAATYTGDQANTYPVIPAAELSIAATVGPAGAAPADLVTVTVPTSDE